MVVESIQLNDLIDLCILGDHFFRASVYRSLSLVILVMSGFIAEFLKKESEHEYELEE